MKTKFMYIIFSILISFTSVNANKLDDIKKSGLLTVGIENELAPFSYLNRSGKRIGFDIDIIEYIAKNLNVKIKYVILPSSELINSVKNSSVDVSISAITHKKTKEQNIDFSLTYLFDGQSIIAKKSSKAENYKSFDTKNVGAVLGNNDGKIFKVISPLSNIVYFNNLPELKEALLNGVVDAATAEESVLYNMLIKNKNKFKMIGKKFTIKPYGIVLPENESKLRDAINLSIQKLVKEKVYNKIYNKWFHKNPSKRPVLWL